MDRAPQMARCGPIHLQLLPPPPTADRPGRGGIGHVIPSREGITQGDPASMFLYAITMTPLAEALRLAFPELFQAFYADDGAAAGKASDIARFMDCLNAWGPSRGYYPEPDKCVLVSTNEAQARVVLARFPFQYRSGHRYVGSFVGPDEDRREWLRPQIQQWLHGVRCLAKVARRFPQTAYAGLVKSLQCEWQYVQRVTPLPWRRNLRSWKRPSGKPSCPPSFLRLSRTPRGSGLPCR